MSDKELSESPTWPYVLAFAKRMESKLAKNRHKGNRDGWLKDSEYSLLNRLREEVAELNDAMDRQESFVEVADEAADVANFAMMIGDKADGPITTT